MKILRCTILLATLLSICAGLFAGGFALSGLGSRAISMAGAFRGQADDPTAIYWNPAGMAFIGQNELALGGSFIQPNSRWTNTLPLPGFEKDKEISAENKMSMFPYLMGVYADNPRTKFGMGVFIPYGLGATYDAFKLPSTMPTQAGPVTPTWSEGFPINESSSKIAVVDIHPSMSYLLMDNLSLGLGFSLLYGTLDLASVKPHPEKSYYIPTSFDMSGKGWGFGGNLGAIYKPIDALSLGLTFKLPSDIPMEGDAEIITWINNYVSAGMGGNLAPAKLGGKSDIEATLKIPGELGMGLSYKLLPNWNVNLDYAYTMWKRLDTVTVTLKDDIVMSGTTPIDDPVLTFNWEDTSRISLGTEYRLGANALRGGFYYDQSPITVDTQIPTISDIGNKMSGNIGFGRDFGPLTVDVNGQYIMFSEREVKTQTLNNMVGVYNSSVIAANLGLSYRF